VNGGWGWGQQDPSDLIITRFDRDSFNISGGMIGGTVGAQIQQGAIVLGFESDLDWADITGSRVTIPAIAGIPVGGVFNFNTKWEALGTARAGTSWRRPQQLADLRHGRCGFRQGDRQWDHALRCALRHIGHRAELRRLTLAAGPGSRRRHGVGFCRELDREG
jgi:hypothetical protein